MGRKWKKRCKSCSSLSKRKLSTLTLMILTRWNLWNYLWPTRRPWIACTIPYLQTRVTQGKSMILKFHDKAQQICLLRTTWEIILSKKNSLLTKGCQASIALFQHNQILKCEPYKITQACTTFHNLQAVRTIRVEKEFWLIKNQDNWGKTAILV